MIEKKVSFKSGGLRLQGILHLPPKTTKTAVIFANGNPDNYLEYHAPIATARILCENGFAALRFNPRGREPSKGSYVTHDGVVNQARDIENAVSFIRRKGFRNIGIVGHSMGGAAAILANKKHIKALVLWEPASVKLWKKFFLKKNILQAIKKQGYYAHKKYGFLIGKNFVSDIIKFESKDIFYRLREKDAVPVLFISGDKTLLSPYAKMYFKEAKGPKSLKIINGATHTFDGYDQEKLLFKYTLEWFNKFL